MTHPLTVAALLAVFVAAMTLLAAYEPGTARRYRRGLAYHRSGRARHAKRREAGDESANEPTTPMPALTPARTA